MSAGFYKNDSGTLLYSPTTVESSGYYLSADSKDDHKYPVDGWHWFDSEEQARDALGIHREPEPA